MSFQVNFNTHGKDLKDALDSVINEQDDTNWLIYAFDKGTYDLRVQETGSGGLEELNDEFSDGKVQFAYAKVIDPNTELPKYVFIGWCGSGVPELRKAFFNSQLSDVSKFFKSFHVQINARDENDVDPQLIMKRVAESSGANYSVHKEGSKPQARVTPVGSVYKKTEIPNIAAMQRESMTKENAPTPVGTNYKPVQTTPRKMEQRWNTATTSGDAGANAVRAEREKFEKEVRDREIEKSRQVSHTPPPAVAAPPAAPPATPSRPQVDFERRDREERENKEQQQREDEQRQQDQQRQREQDEQRQREEEQENYRRQQEEEDRRQQEVEDNYRRQQEEEDNHRRQQDEQRQREEEDRHRQQQEEQRRKEDEQRKQQEEQRRQEEQERNHRQQQEEEHRRQQEAEEEERQREEAARLQNELNQTADRAVHAAGTAAASATASSDASQGVSAVVLFAYDASESNEMTLFEGEVVHQIDQVDEGWWFGVSEDGKKQGLFPANYVQILEPEQHQEQDIPPPPPAPPAPAPPQAPQAPLAPLAPTPPQAPQVEEQGNVAVALYDYQAEEDNEISFVEGDIITQIDFVSEDWWQGVSANGKSNGLFPANYVELKK